MRAPLDLLSFLHSPYTGNIKLGNGGGKMKGAGEVEDLFRETRSSVIQEEVGDM